MQVNIIPSYNTNFTSKHKTQNSDKNPNNSHYKRNIIGGLSALALLGTGILVAVKMKKSKSTVITDNFANNFMTKIQNKFSKNLELIKKLPEGNYEIKNGKYVESAGFNFMKIEKNIEGEKTIFIKLDDYHLKRVIFIDKEGNIKKYKIFNVSTGLNPIRIFEKTKNGYNYSGLTNDAIDEHRKMHNIIKKNSLQISNFLHQV